MMDINVDLLQLSKIFFDKQSTLLAHKSTSSSDNKN